MTALTEYEESVYRSGKRKGAEAERKKALKLIGDMKERLKDFRGIGKECTDCKNYEECDSDCILNEGLITRAEKYERGE